MDSHTENGVGSRVSRRRFLTGAGGVAAGAAAMGPLSAFLASCGSTSTASSISGGLSGAPRSGGTLTIAIDADPNGLDPESVLNNNAGFVMATIHDGLTAYKPGTTEVVPGLAEKWDISSDGTSYTFHLRQGVTFQDGSPFDADAVVAWLNRLLDKNDPNYYGKQTGIDSFVDFTFGTVKSYQKVDQYTVTVQLSSPSVEFLTSLAMVWSGVTSPTAVKQLGFGLMNHPVGTGPFSFVEWVRNDHITVKANPKYWGGKPHLDKIIFQIIPDQSTQLLRLQGGQLDVMNTVLPEQVSAIKKNSNLRLLTQPGLAALGVSFPMQVAPFSNKTFRQALNYATNKQSYNKYLFSGLAQTMKAPMPPVEWGTDLSLSPYAYDPQKAKSMIKQAGVKTPFSFDMWVYNTTRGYNPAGGVKLATALQADWQKVGINAKLQTLEWTSYLTKIRSDSFAGVCLEGWSGDNGDPDDFMSPLFSQSGIPATNASHYSNPQVNSLLQQAVGEVDKSKRQQLYFQAQKLVWEDAPWVWLNIVDQVQASTTKVHGLKLNPTEMYFNMNTVWKG